VLVDAAGMFREELYLASETTFFILSCDVEIAFVRNERGEVSQATITLSGSTLAAVKIE